MLNKNFLTFRNELCLIYFTTMKHTKVAFRIMKEVASLTNAK
jgi:hypothetical protein